MKSIKTAVVVTHGIIRGPAHEIRDYLRKISTNTLFVYHPLLFLKQNYALSSAFEIYRNDKLTFQKKANHWVAPEPVLYLKDLIYTLIWVSRYARKTDLFIGSGNLNAFAGLILRNLGLAKKVIYYCIDYVPERFGNRLLNYLYHWVDKVCAQGCDSTWNLSQRMIEGREKKWNKKFPHQQVVPHGSYTDKQTKSLVSLNNFNRYEIVYMGTLLKKQGVQLVIETLGRVIKKFPQARLLVIGSGDYKTDLELLTKKLGLEKHVTFTGYLTDAQAKVKIAHAHVGVALYNKKEDIFTYYSDPGKVKYYLSLGIPLIITDVPLVAKDLTEQKCALMINYNMNELQLAFERFFTDMKFTEDYRRNAVKFSEKFGWETLYKKALRKV
jgi:glycosyltransferase involved in cell wall biosynthesis